jgi:hypothetical protein
MFSTGILIAIFIALFFVLHGLCSLHVDNAGRPMRFNENVVRILFDLVALLITVVHARPSPIYMKI